MGWEIAWNTSATSAGIIYYLTLSIAGPLALMEDLKAKKRDRLEKEYNTFHELDNRFFGYQKLALEHCDLDILDVPNNDLTLAFDKKRQQEKVAHSIFLSLFQRAFLGGRGRRAGAFGWPAANGCRLTERRQ